MALTILTAGLAACGLLLLLWSVAEAMLLPLPREDAVLVAPLQGRRGRGGAGRSAAAAGCASIAACAHKLSGSTAA